MVGGRKWLGPGPLHMAPLLGAVPPLWWQEGKRRWVGRRGMDLARKLRESLSEGSKFWWREKKAVR